MNATIREIATDATHRILGSAPGWAHCDAWIDARAETVPDGTPITCRVCAMHAARETT